MGREGGGSTALDRVRGLPARQVAPAGLPYWFLPSAGGESTPATYEELADTAGGAAPAKVPCLPYTC